MAESMKEEVSSLLRGIDRYNPENLIILEQYIEFQARDNTYDLEANLAVLKLYQLNPVKYNDSIVQLILLKALTNLPHTDFVLCKCLLDPGLAASESIKVIIILHDLLETCQFSIFWARLRKNDKIASTITGFENSIRKFICHVVNITYQTIEKGALSAFLGNLNESDLKLWMNKYGWKECEPNLVFIGNQEENIKTKNITEKIDFDSVADIMSLAR